MIHIAKGCVIAVICSIQVVQGAGDSLQSNKPVTLVHHSGKKHMK